MSFTVELGPSYYTCYERCFDPPYSAVEGLWQENKAPALYLLKIADAPSQAYGPEATDVALVTAGLNLTLTAVLSDMHSGGQDIIAAEFFVDALGGPGMGWLLAPADGVFDSPQEQVIATLPWAGPTHPVPARAGCRGALGAGERYLLGRVSSFRTPCDQVTLRAAAPSR